MAATCTGTRRARHGGSATRRTRWPGCCTPGRPTRPGAGCWKSAAGSARRPSTWSRAARRPASRPSTSRPRRWPARAAVAASAPAAVVRWQQADLFDLPFADGAFDHLFVCFVLEHLADPAAAAAGLRRVLAPGGTITVIEGDHGSAFFHPDSPAARAAIGCLVALQAAAGGNGLLGRQLQPLLAAAGYRDIQVTPRTVYVDAPPALVEGFTRNTFTAMVAGVRDEAVAAGLMTPGRVRPGPGRAGAHGHAPGHLQLHVLQGRGGGTRLRSSPPSRSRVYEHVDLDDLRASETVKPITEIGVPVHRSRRLPHAPFTSAGGVAERLRPGEHQRLAGHCRAPATPEAPGAPARPRRRAARRRDRAPRAARRSRRRARRRGTRRPPRAGGRGRRRAPAAPPWTRRRARLASWRAAAGDAADDRRDLVERHGEHVVQHEREPLGRGRACRARRAAPARPSRRAAPRARGRCRRVAARRSARARRASSGSSRRDLRERSMSRHTRATTVVSQPPRFSTPLVSARLSRSHASCTASSASVREPSIR